MKWLDEDFHSIDRQDFYNILQLRERIFVVEQFCPYIDCDGKDATARHIYTKADNKIAAYSRLVDIGIVYENAASIGRIITHPDFRGKGYGHFLLVESIKKMEQHYGKVKVSIGAQCYLENFYKKYGFSKVGEMYTEDGIPHYKMDLNWDNTNTGL